MSGSPSARHSDGSCHSNGSPESASAPHPVRGKRERGREAVAWRQRIGCITRRHHHHRQHHRHRRHWYRRAFLPQVATPTFSWSGQTPAGSRTRLSWGHVNVVTATGELPYTHSEWKGEGNEDPVCSFLRFDYVHVGQLWVVFQATRLRLRKRGCHSDGGRGQDQFVKEAMTSWEMRGACWRFPPFSLF